MRAPTDMPRRRTRRPGRGRVLLIVAAVIVFLLFTSLRQLADFWTDYLWFDSVGFSKIWSKSLSIKLELGAVFTLVFFVALWLNLLVADKISPKFHPLGPDEELLNRYHQVIDRRAGLLRILVALVFAVLTGAGMAGQWNEWILFRNGGDFGTVDPQFGLDVGFYIFRLPFLVNLVDWLFASQVIILLIVAVAHYLNGGIRMQSPFERVTPQVKAHLSVLLALLSLTKAADYWLQRYEILFSDRSSVVNGATNTEVNAVLPALTLLIIIALASFVLFILNIRRRGWVLPVIAVGIWGFVAIAMGEIYPAVYERLIVVPEQSSREAVPIHNNIVATRQAYGLDKVETKTFDYSPSIEVAARSVNANPEITRNIQLLDPHRVNDTFQKLQSRVAPSSFAQVDTDRYQMKVPGGGTAETQVVVANREVNPDTIPQQSWEGRTLTYTHGYGLALAAGNAVTQGGSPDFAVRDIPVTTTPAIDLNIEQPNNYYFSPDIFQGQKTLSYSIIGTSAPEFDFVKRSSDPTQPYAGKGGVQLDSLARRLAFALKFNDPNMIISQYISDQSRILYLRKVTERVATVAPFLSFDANPYPVVANGRTVYVIDAYTTSDYYPNSQRYAAPDGVLGSDLRVHQFNYIRNSVKAVVDTYDGTVSIYVVDKNDPVAAAYQSAFPELFKERSEISQELRAHLRYPEDIFRVQTQMWGRYHLEDANAFYARDNAWQPPPNPPDSPPNAVQTSSPGAVAQPLLLAPTSTSSSTPRQSPFYVINRLQGDADPSFMIMRPFQPYSDNDSKNTLTAFMVAQCDGDELGKLRVYVTNEQDNIDGPAIVSSRMLSDPQVSAQITLLAQQGSSVKFGELTLVPYDKSIVFVRSMYVIADTSQQQVPVVRDVIVSMGGKVVIKRTLREALAELLPGANPLTFEGAPDTNASPPENATTNPPGSGTTIPGTSVPGSGVPNTSVPDTTTTVPPAGGEPAALANGALQDLQDAQKALDNNDLGGYQRKVDDATKKLQQLQALYAASGSSDSTTTTSTTTTALPAGST